MLPFSLIPAAFQGAEALLELNVAFNRPLRARLGAVSTLAVACLCRVIVALGAAFYVWWDVSSTAAFRAEFSQPGHMAMNKIYCVISVGGGFLLALINCLC